MSGRKTTAKQKQLLSPSKSVESRVTVAIDVATVALSIDLSLGFEKVSHQLTGLTETVRNLCETKFPGYGPFLSVDDGDILPAGQPHVPSCGGNVAALQD